MKEKKNLFISIIILAIIAIIVSIVILYQKNFKDNSPNNNIQNNINENNDTTKENEAIESLPGEELTQTELNNLNNYFNDILNSQMTYMNFSEPSKLLTTKDNLDYLDYIVSQSKYATYHSNDHVPEYSITLEGIKKTLKELTNYDYSNNQISEYFQTFYNKEEKAYVILGGGAAMIPEIESSYKIGNQYYFKLTNESNVVLNKVNEKYYFYSCQSFETSINENKLDNLEIKNSEVKELYSYISASINSHNVCLGYYYQNPFKNHTLEDKISLVLINYGIKHRKNIDNNFLKKFNENDQKNIKTNSEYYIDADVIKQGMKKIFNIDISEFKERNEPNNYYHGYYYRKDVNAFISVSGGGGYEAEIIQQIIEYNESDNEINLTVVKAEVGYEDDHVYRYINNKKTKVFENIDNNFQFTNENVTKFPQIKYIFKKNNNGQYYLSNIINLNFEEDFENCQ